MGADVHQGSHKVPAIIAIPCVRRNSPIGFLTTMSSYFLQIVNLIISTIVDIERWTRIDLKN